MIVFETKAGQQNCLTVLTQFNNGKIPYNDKKAI